MVMDKNSVGQFQKWLPASYDEKVKFTYDLYSLFNKYSKARIVYSNFHTYYFITKT